MTLTMCTTSAKRDRRQACLFARAATKSNAYEAFTLIELLAVVVLVAVAVGIVTLRLDGFSEQGRLRAATRQLGALIRLAQTDARTAGRAVILRYEKNKNEVAVLRPTVRGNEVVWLRTPGLELAGSATIAQVIDTLENGKTPDDRNHHDVRIEADGIFDSHRLQIALRSGRHVDVRIDGITGEVVIDDASDTEPEPQP